jgi:hypothetical protein
VYKPICRQRHGKSIARNAAYPLPVQAKYIWVSEYFGWFGCRHWMLGSENNNPRLRIEETEIGAMLMVTFIQFTIPKEFGVYGGKYETEKYTLMKSKTVEDAKIEAENLIRGRIGNV